MTKLTKSERTELSRILASAEKALAQLPPLPPAHNVRGPLELAIKALAQFIIYR